MLCTYSIGQTDGESQKELTLPMIDQCNDLTRAGGDRNALFLRSHCSSAGRSGTSQSHGVRRGQSSATRHLLAGAPPTAAERRGGGHLLTAGGRWLFTRSAGPPPSFVSSWSPSLYIASCRPTDWTILTTPPPGGHCPLVSISHFPPGTSCASDWRRVTCRMTSVNDARAIAVAMTVVDTIDVCVAPGAKSGQTTASWGRKKRRAPSQPAATIIVVDDTKTTTSANGGVTVVAVDAEEQPTTTDMSVIDVDCDPGHSNAADDLPLPAGATTGDRAASGVANSATTAAGDRATTTTTASLVRCADPRRPISPNIELTSWRLSSFDPCTRLSSAAVPLHRTSRTDDLLAAPSLGSLGETTVLSPEQLSRYFSGRMVTPFARFEEDSMWLESESDRKGCCFQCSQTNMIRLFVAVISLIGLACVAVGILLGALTVSGTTRLTLCLLMIGVGIVLITVSAIAWRLTSFDVQSRPIDFWSMIGNRSIHQRTNRTVYGREALPTTPYFRVHQGMFVPEYAWPPPPPNYHTTIRNPFHLRRSQPSPRPAASSPPPTYRTSSTNATWRPTVLSPGHRPPSRPPSYRSQESLNTITIDLPSAFSPQTSSQQSDRQHLVAPQSPTAEGEAPHATTSLGSNLLTIAVEDSATSTCVSIIDCSAAVPVGFAFEGGNSAKNESSISTTYV
uniref:Uncharacterized protein n=3 Tax=Plectus sambesii TaxID=2011161 RepID=A0A914W811_9BILA